MLTKQQLSSIAPMLKEPKLTAFSEAINATMEAYNISSPSQVAMFIAQLMHESGECRYVEELASGKAYEGREDLGNTKPGDGVRFKGRGLIQITGRFNYLKLSKAFNLDFVNNPELLETPTYAALSAGWFWASRELNKIAETNSDASFLIITKRINGGTNGLEDRKMYWARAKKVLGI
jgi:putative chitinase